MEEQRTRARAAPPPRTAPSDRHERAGELRRRGGRRPASSATRDRRAHAPRGVSRGRGRKDGRALWSSWTRPPSTPAGGGQVADSGVLDASAASRARRGRLPGRRRPGARGEPRARRAEGRRARSRPGSTGDPPRDDAQPHRDPPAARGAARAARHPRAPGRLRRPPRQAALRLHPRPGAQRPRSCATSRTASTSGSKASGPVRCARDGAVDEARAAGRDGAVRREVRRVGAGGRGGRRQSRASSAAAPTSPARRRSGCS